MKAKQPSGMRNPTRMEYWSASQPMTKGSSAPPTIDITSKDEANLVWSPRPRMLNAKIVGNMMDMKKKQRNKAATDAQASGAMMTSMRTTFPIAKKAKTVSARKKRMR